MTRGRPAGASAIGAVVGELEKMLPDLQPPVVRESLKIDYLALAGLHNKRTKH